MRKVVFPSEEEFFEFLDSPGTPVWGDDTPWPYSETRYSVSAGAHRIELIVHPAEGSFRCKIFHQETEIARFDYGMFCDVSFEDSRGKKVVTVKKADCGELYLRIFPDFYIAGSKGGYPSGSSL